MNHATPIRRHLILVWPKMVTLLFAVFIVELFCHFHSFILEAITCYAIWRICNFLFENIVPAHHKNHRS